MCACSSIQQVFVLKLLIISLCQQKVPILCELCLWQAFIPDVHACIYGWPTYTLSLISRSLQSSGELNFYQWQLRNFNSINNMEFSKTSSLDSCVDKMTKNPISRDHVE